MPSTQAVIFDFDGVLVDSEPLHEWAILSSLADRGWTCTHEQFIAHIVGRGDHNAYRQIGQWNSAAVSEDEIAALLSRKWVLMAEGVEAGRFAIQPGAYNAVTLAASRLPTGVCSGSVRSTVRPMLERIGLIAHLGALVCGDDVPRMKPHPDGYLLAARNLGADPARCVAIEDTPTGVLAAKSAGVRVIAVTHTVPAHMLREADLVLSSIAEINERVLGIT